MTNDSDKRIVEYNTLKDKTGKYTKYIVDKETSEDANPGLILKNMNNERRFAISGEGMKRIKGYIPPSNPPTAPQNVAPHNTPKMTETNTTENKVNNQSDSTGNHKINVHLKDENGEDKNTHDNNSDSKSDSTSTGRKVWNTTKKIGAETAAVAGAATESALSKLRNSGKSVGGPGDGGKYNDSDSDGGLTLIFWLAVFIQFFDIMTGSQRPGYILSAYVILIILGAVFVFKNDKTNEVGMIFAMAAAYFLPWLTQTSFIRNAAAVSNLTLLLTGLIVLIPVVPLYIAFKFSDRSVIKKWAKLVIAFWVIVFALYAITTFMPDQSSKILMNNPMAGVKYVWGIVGKTMDKTTTSIDNAFKRAVAQATGQPYDGQEESQVGIYVEDVRPLESRYNSNSKVFVEAKIRATNVKEKMNINTICYIENVKQGTVNPTILYNVIGEYDNIVSCSLGQLKEGNYEVKVRANFEFESTSDIEYTFVGSDIKSDQYSKLNINPTSIATYTGGPVELGLPSLTQPLRIDIDKLNLGLSTQTNTQLSSYPFGVSLRNNWPQGRVIRGLKYILNVPKEVTLVDCSRNATTILEPDPATNRNTYTFMIDTTNAQDMFDAVTCRVNINDVKGLLGNDLKSVKTFAARAQYEYAVEGTTTLVIEKNTDVWTQP